jgi:sentrin-specific protease 1
MMTSQEEELVRRELGRDDDDGVVSIIRSGQNAENRVTVRSLKTLKPTIWLCDEVINGFMNWHNKRHQTNCQMTGSHLQHYAFTTMFVEQLYRFGYDGVRSWTNRVPGQDLWKFKTVLFPINRNNCHWMMAVAFMDERCVRYYDSLDYGEGESPQKRYTEMILRYLRFEHYERHRRQMDQWNEEVVATPKQKNGYDCGAFVCAFAEHIFDQKPMEFS